MKISRTIYLDKYFRCVVTVSEYGDFRFQVQDKTFFWSWEDCECPIRVKECEFRLPQKTNPFIYRHDYWVYQKGTLDIKEIAIKMLEEIRAKRVDRRDSLYNMRERRERAIKLLNK